MNKTVFIFINGDFGELSFVKDLITQDDIIIGCDGGTDRVYELGLTPNLVVGDFDSATNIPSEVMAVDADSQQLIIVNDIKYYKFPKDKYNLDSELAIDKAIELRPRNIVIVNPIGLELDHVIGTLFLLSKNKYLNRNIKIITKNQIIYYKSTSFTIKGGVGDKISLMPINDQAKVLKTTGLKYDLAVNKMQMQINAGVSNQLIDKIACVDMLSGGLLIVHHRRPSQIDML
ncbi:thiamine diphosphokinase [Candidatus Saccharibacteria bacterium]|nr:thiamine diphosphokinase [Candidatus Saccharibacteria bacterium]